MQTLSGKDAKYAYGRVIDLARAQPVGSPSTVGPSL